MFSKNGHRKMMTVFQKKVFRRWLSCPTMGTKVFLFHVQHEMAPRRNGKALRAQTVDVTGNLMTSQSRSKLYVSRNTESESSIKNFCPYAVRRPGVLPRKNSTQDAGLKSNVPCCASDDDIICGVMVN
ncbi:unnamed protein product, partial [Nesidiocoris tenuis]